MKLVIDIPDVMYEQFKDGMWCGNHTIGHAIEDGIPLPKGHGRIIDESKITACEWDGQQMTTNAPTIIAADTEDDRK